VTEEVHRNHHSGVTAKTFIKVQPLKKDEMQPLYAQDMGLEAVTHGFYGSMMQTLGSCIGFIGAVPCCPCPNPFKEVRQGTIATDFTLYLQPHIAFGNSLTDPYPSSRFRGTRLALRPVLQGCRSRLGPGQCLHRSAAYRGRQDTNYFDWPTDRDHSRQCERRNVMFPLSFFSHVWSQGSNHVTVIL
jgi:hypothetical protein